MMRLWPCMLTLQRKLKDFLALMPRDQVEGAQVQLESYGGL
jgi:hypothetical protein